MDVSLTELEQLEVTRVDAVRRPANGFPVLIMKGVAEPAAEAITDEPPAFDHEAAVAAVKAIVGRKVDESPDIAGGNAVLAQIADLIIAEAQEMKAGNTGEIADIQQLACAAEMIWCWRTGEESVAAGSVMPATALMQSVKAIEETAQKYPAAKMAVVAIDGRGATMEDVADAMVLLGDHAAKGGPSAEERRQAASEGNALPDGSYPIRNAHELHSAAVLARSGHGDVAAAKKLIARRARELGVKNPLDDDTSKSRLAEQETAVDTETQVNDGQIAKAVEDAIAKAVAPVEELRRELEETLAKVKALPVPGGPVMSVVRPKTAADGTDHAAKAIYYDDMAERVSDPSRKADYRQLAAQERAKLTP